MESNLPFDTNQNNLMPEGEHHPDKILQKRIRKARKERREARQNRIIGIINSTWASIARAEGAQRLVDGRRSLPTEDQRFPYYRVDSGIRIPATYSDYCLLLRYRHLSIVPDVRLQFERQCQTYSYPVIVVDEMTKYQHENLTECVRLWLVAAFQNQPAAQQGRNLLLKSTGSPTITIQLHHGPPLEYRPDATFAVKGGYARVLVEVAKGQSEESMLRKGKIYHHGSGGGYSVLLMLNFTENGDDYRAELWVWKFHKVYEPTSADRNANRMAKDDLCRKVEVYPRDLTDNWVLTMTRQDLHPRSNGPFEPETVIEIALSNLHEQLVETFEEIKLRDAELPFNPGRPLSHSDSEPSVNGTRVLTGLPSESSTSDSSDHSEYDPKA